MTFNRSWGPWLVGIGAALWGTETLWRVTLSHHYPPDVLVFIEHLYCVLACLPLLWVHRAELKGVQPRTWAFLVGSGILGSAVGTYFFTLALHTVNLTTANVLLNIQPVMSALFARALLAERFPTGFAGWAGLALVAGVMLALKTLSPQGLVVEWGLWMILVTALCWSFSTVAGRAVNLGMSVWVSAPLRLIIGMVATGGIVALNGHFNAQALNLAAFSQWQTHQDFLLLSVFAGVIPLFLYFKGLSLTPAGIAAFFEMFQIVAALVVTWGYFGQTLAPHQILGGGLLILAVAKLSLAEPAAPEPVIQPVLAAAGATTSTAEALPTKSG